MSRTIYSVLTSRIPNYQPPQMPFSGVVSNFRELFELSESFGRLAYIEACRTLTRAAKYLPTASPTYQSSIVDTVEYASHLYMQKFSRDMECRITLCYMLAEVDRRILDHGAFTLMLKMAAIRIVLVENQINPTHSSAPSAAKETCLLPSSPLILSPSVDELLANSPLTASLSLSFDSANANLNRPSPSTSPSTPVINDSTTQDPSTDSRSIHDILNAMISSGSLGSLHVKTDLEPTDKESEKERDGGLDPRKGLGLGLATSNSSECVTRRSSRLSSRRALSMRATRSEKENSEV